MIELIQPATRELARFLADKLPTLSADWWESRVVANLSFQQQRMVQEREIKTLQQLDFAALLRLLDYNWRELSSSLNLSREARSWVKELQAARNKWAHLSSEDIPPGELYRDADSLGRLLAEIGSEADSLGKVEACKNKAVVAMAKEQAGSSAVADEPETSEKPVESGPTTPVADSGDKAQFEAGELVALRSDPKIIVSILKVIEGGRERRYTVFQNNSKETYYESQLQTVGSQDDDPELLSATGLKARLTALHLLSPSTSNLFSLRAGRVQFVPYQYRPVLKLIRSDRPRLLIADEVGVGKTIEAGLIIKELRARRDLKSVLIICPKALVAERKWELEMKRFNEPFEALDGKLLRHCLNETDLDGEWPERRSKAILPFSLIDRGLVYGKESRRGPKIKGLLEMDPPPKFDLVIVDEAHNIRNTDTFLHQGVRCFCENAEAVVFLTATPVQLGSNDLFTLLNVLRPDLVIDKASFNQMAEPNPGINEAIRCLRAKPDGWQEAALTHVDEAARTDWGTLFLREAPTFQNIYDSLSGEPIEDADRVRLIRELEETYTFSGLINRTRRRDIGEFTTRRSDTVTIEFTSPQKKLHDGLLAVIAKILTYCHGGQNVQFMMTTIRRQAASCLYGLAPMLEDILAGKLDQIESLYATESDEDLELSFVGEIRADIEQVIAMAHELDEKDPKVEAFKQVVTDKSRMANNKVLLFSTFRHTLRYLVLHTEKTGLRYGLIHGAIPDEDRADLRRRFALPKEDPTAVDILLSSEVGCEGLDFQFCDMLVNYDLPWNPMKIEQRIGRIDRYGQQSEAVAIVNLITPGTVDGDIYQRCLSRIGVFQHAIGGNEDILGEITQDIKSIAENFELNAEQRAAKLQQVSDNGIRKIREEQDLEEKQAELFGLNVPAAKWEEEIEAAESSWLAASAIQQTVASYLKARLGSDTEHLLGEKAIKTLRLGQDARNTLLEDFRSLPRSNEPTARFWEKWLKGGHPTLTVTFDQEAANDEPKAVHLWFPHPLVRQAAEYHKPSEVAYTVVSATSRDVPAGEHRFALYRWRKQGVKTDETLEPVAEDPLVEAKLLQLLQQGEDVAATDPPAKSAFDDLETRHHEKWNLAKAHHIGINRETVEHRRQSLKVSHRARCKSIEDQITRANNPRIEVMKRSELTSANADYERRMAELDSQAASGDIHATPVVFGLIRIS